MAEVALPQVDLWADPAALALRLAPVHARMATAVADRGADTAGLYGWLRYHLGWAELDGRPVALRSAKGIRPLVALVACAGLGGSPADAVDVAAAVELTHEFSLIHDDLEDGDALRRGRPALWTAVGAAQAINAGDALFAIARAVLTGAAGPPERRLDLLRRYDEACLALAEGQFQDIGFEQRSDVRPAEYEAMVRRKTGSMLGLAAALGGGAAGASRAEADQLQHYGEAVGVAFQMQDDLLGLWGDPERTGKPAGADLMRRKKSLPILLATSLPELGADLRALLGSPEVSAEAAQAMADRMAAAGVYDQVADEARAWVRIAAEALADVALLPGPAAELLGLAQAAVARER